MRLPLLLLLMTGPTWGLAQARIELVVPYDGTSNNFVRIGGYLACAPSIYKIRDARISGAQIDLLLDVVRPAGGCPPNFSGTPTEKASFVSLGEALGDNVTLPSPIEIRVRDSAGQVFGTGIFQSAQPMATIPLENGCYAPLSYGVCIERHLNDLHLGIDYYPYSDATSSSIARTSAISVHGDARLRNNYALFELRRPKATRMPSGDELPEYDRLGAARFAVISPTEFVLQYVGEPSFVGRIAPWVFTSDWARVGNGSRWLLSLGSSGLFGGFKIRFGNAVFPGSSNLTTPDFSREGAAWEFPAEWDFGVGRLSCTPASCQLFLTFSASGPEFSVFRLPKGGLGVIGAYTERGPGVWERVLIRAED